MRRDAVEEHVAARLGDVEQADGQAVERRRTGRPGPGDRTALARGVQQCRHVPTSHVTGSEPIFPLAQPPMMPENSPAPPPVWAMSRPPSRNFGSVTSANASGHALLDAVGAAHQLVAVELEQRAELLAEPGLGPARLGVDAQVLG